MMRLIVHETESGHKQDSFMELAIGQSTIELRT
jgi:hypothetical protein